MSDIEDEIRRRILAERAVEKRDVPAAPAPERPYYVPPPPPTNPSFLQRKQRQGGLVGAIASVLLVLAKVGAPLIALLAKLKFLVVGLKLLPFGKVLLTFGSMLLSMWLYARFYGWPFGIGIVLLIFVHECGHALAARLRGLPVTLMIFVPFLGAAVFRKSSGTNLAENAFVAIMGPVGGAVAASACLAGYAVTHSPFWLALAAWGFLLNLFNLAPIGILDGSKIVPCIFGKRRANPAAPPYFPVTRADRWRFGIAYFGLAAFLGVGYALLRHFLVIHYPVLA